LFYINTEAFGESTGRWAVAGNYLKNRENRLSIAMKSVTDTLSWPAKAGHPGNTSSGFGIVMENVLRTQRLAPPGWPTVVGHDK
jgi:hypothetical protein